MRGGARSVAASDDEAGLDSCFVCQTEVSEAKPKLWRGKLMHGACFNAVRSGIRQCAPKAKQRFPDSVENDVGFFRDAVTPLIVGGKKARSSSARSQFQRRVLKSDQKYTGSEMRKGLMLFTKQRYKGFMRTWEARGDSEASREFDDLLDEATEANTDSDGEPRVWVKGNDTVDKTKGTNNLKQTIKERVEGDDLDSDGFAGTAAYRSIGSGSLCRRSNASSSKRPSSSRFDPDADASGEDSVALLSEGAPAVLKASCTPRLRNPAAMTREAIRD